MQAKHSLEFARAPAVWSMYPKIMVSRKPSLVPEGGEVPRIESRLAKVVIDRKHLAQYSQICGAAAGATLPIAYPHILAMPLHLAMLGAEAFPVKLFGLVHVQNRIAMREPLSADEAGGDPLLDRRPSRYRARPGIRSAHRIRRGGRAALGRDLHVPRAQATRRRAPRKTTTVSRAVENGADGVAIKSSSFRAPAGLGRRYGFISGDVNPIHMSDLTARAFGFPRAIAHGMWSLGRLASDFEAEQFNGGCELTVNFKLPIYMPAWLMLQRWEIENGSAFALRDAQGEKPHLTGTLKSLR